jgi:hypothetical protein
MYNKLELNLNIRERANTSKNNKKKNGTPRKPSRPNINANVKTPPRPSPRTSKINSSSLYSSNNNTSSYNGSLLNSPQFNSTTGTDFDLTRFSSFESSLFPYKDDENYERLSPTWKETLDETKREEKIIKVWNA